MLWPLCVRIYSLDSFHLCLHLFLNHQCPTVGFPPEFRRSSDRTCVNHQVTHPTPMLGWWHEVRHHALVAKIRNDFVSLEEKTHWEWAGSIKGVPNCERWCIWMYGDFFEWFIYFNTSCFKNLMNKTTPKWRTSSTSFVRSYLFAFFFLHLAFDTSRFLLFTQVQRRCISPDYSRMLKWTNNHHFIS